MGSCSTHHITVTKALMARKRANRSYIQGRKKNAYKGKYGDRSRNHLADAFRSKRGHLLPHKELLSATEKAYIRVVAIITLVIGGVIIWLC